MPENKTFVKICGITSIEQAIQIAFLGVDAIGIISVKDSPRYIPQGEKQKIFKTLKNSFPNIERVTVLKNNPIDFIFENFFDDPIESVIQLHGDEDIEYCRNLKKKLPNLNIWKAFRIKNKEDVEKIKPYEDFVDAILLDSWNNETYGGSGKKIDQNFLKDLKFSKPWLLAGGVSIEWIKQIVMNIKPYGVDISSSVEISPGIKDLEKTNDLLKEIKGF